MSSSSDLELEEGIDLKSSPPLVEASLPPARVDHGPSQEASLSTNMAPSRKQSGKDRTEIVQRDTANLKDGKVRIKPEQLSSQSGPQATASSYAHTKGLMGPPPTKPSRLSAPESQIVPETQVEDEGIEDAQDQLHASQPSTPEEQSSIAPEPGEPLEAFDWYELQVKYHDMIKERDVVEQQLLQDFEHLSQV